MKSLAEQISQGINKRSADPRHADNVLDADWQAGYFIGSNLTKETQRELHDELHPISVEWERRGKPMRPTPEFRSWKDGYWAGVFSKYG